MNHITVTGERRSHLKGHVDAGSASIVHLKGEEVTMISRVWFQWCDGWNTQTISCLARVVWLLEDLHDQ